MNMSHALDSLKSQRIAANFSVGDFAKKAGVNDATIRIAEAGGTCHCTEGQRIADALGISLVTLGERDL
jgi:hypothetical protein